MNKIYILIETKLVMLRPFSGCSPTIHTYGVNSVERTESNTYQYSSEIRLFSVSPVPRPCRNFHSTPLDCFTMNNQNVKFAAHFTIQSFVLMVYAKLKQDKIHLVVRIYINIFGINGILLPPPRLFI